MTRVWRSLCDGSTIVHLRHGKPKLLALNNHQCTGARIIERAKLIDNDTARMHQLAMLEQQNAGNRKAHQVVSTGTKPKWMPPPVGYFAFFVWATPGKPRVGPGLPQGVYSDVPS